MGSSKRSIPIFTAVTGPEESILKDADRGKSSKMPCNRCRLFLVLSAALLLLSGEAAAARTAALVGGWSPIKNISDPHVQEIGKFTVTEHNRLAATNLKFQSVVSGESQVVSGVNYRLVVAAVDGGVSNKYEAVVWEKTWVGFRSLISFRRV